MAKAPAVKKAKKDDEASGFTPDPGAWSRFERATDAVVKAAEREKSSRKPARIVRKAKKINK